MGKYTIGVDLASGSDWSSYTILMRRNIRWYHFWLKRLHLIKHLPSPYKQIDQYTPLRQEKVSDLVEKYFADSTNVHKSAPVRRLKGE